MFLFPLKDFFVRLQHGKQGGFTMNLLEETLAYNRQFVSEKQYEQYQSGKYPDKRLVILSCMDTRLVELLPKSINMRNGDVKIIKNAGATITHPFGSITRSLIIAVYDLNADEIMVIGHKDCGMGSVEPKKVIEKMIDRGIPKKRLEVLKYSGHDLEEWLHGFDCVEDNVRHSCVMISNHPLIPEGIPVHGLVMDPNTGALELIRDGYTALQNKE